MKYKAVIFDFDGVLVPHTQTEVQNYEKKLKFPAGFLNKVLKNGGADNSFSKLERGDILFSEFLTEFEKEVETAAKRDKVNIGAFSAAELIQKMTPDCEFVHKEMLQAVNVLKQNKIKTCVLTNNWIDERPESRKKMKNFRMMLRWYFDVVVESSVERIRKPDKKIYEIACSKMKVDPKEAIFLEVTDESTKPVTDFGGTFIKVVSPTRAVQELEKLTGLKILGEKLPEFVYPLPCKPGDVPHAVANIKPDLKVHYVDVGSGPVVMFFHGFPDIWYIWRNQIPAVASAGFRVIAMDQKGFGDSCAPNEVQEYTQQKLTEDAIALMDFLGIDQATVVGHDWGGRIVWNLALFYPHRLNGVCSIVTPLPAGEGMKKLLSQPQTFDYQKYFQKEGVAEKELEEDYARTFKLFFRGVLDAKLRYPDDKEIKRDFTNVTQRGGVFVGHMKDIPIGKLLTEDVLEYYVEQFKKNGFRGPLNWYRNGMAMMEWLGKVQARKVTVSGLMMTAAHDTVLKPEFSEGMEERIPNLTRVALQNCSHWAPIESPYEVNMGLIKWLGKIH